MALSAVYESVAAPHNWTGHRHYPCEAWSSKTNWLALFERGGGGGVLYSQNHIKHINTLCWQNLNF
jgi:hypothetical protein